jgi:bacteriocin-type transport-associated protein
MPTSSFDLLSQSSPALLQALEVHAHRRQFDAPTVLIREGEAANAISIVTAGCATVETLQSSGERVVLAQGERGAMFGEMSWLEQRPAVASVRAEAGSSVLQVPTAALDQLCQTSPIQAAELFRLIGTKLSLQIQAQNAWIHRFNASLQEPLRKVLVLFAALNEQDVDWLRQIGRLQRLADGAVLIEAGEPVPALYLVLAGEARILVHSDSGIREVGSSRRGELLGEMSLLNPELGVASATVVSHGGLELLRLDKAELLSALEAAPLRAMRFWCALARMLSQRSRDQLLERGLAEASRIAEQQSDGDELDLTQLAAISTAGSRFDWLCRQFQNQEG